MQFQFCQVCRQNHNRGRAHRYAATHKQRLDVLLGKILKKVQEVRFFVKNVVRLTEDARDRNKFWCHFCEQEIKEQSSVFACAEAIGHLASKHHVEAVKKFWFDNGGDIEKRNLYIIAADSLEKWEEACKVAPVLAGVDDTGYIKINNIHSDRSSTDAASTENVISNSVVIGSSLAVKPLSVLTDQSFQDGNLSSGSVRYASASARETLHSMATPVLQQQHISGFSQQKGKSLMQDTQESLDQMHSELQSTAWEEPRPVMSSQILLQVIPRTLDTPGLNKIPQPIVSREEVSGLIKSQMDQSVRGAPETVQRTDVELGQNLTAIQVSSLNPGEGNVHTGALPPWLKKSNSLGNGSQMSLPSHSLPLSRTQERKLAKLRNPKRVGAAWSEQRRAELEREQRGEIVERSYPDSSSWLPSFGSVWQSGSRRETRKEFEAEKRSNGLKRGSSMGKRTSYGTSNRESIRPYISKRQRMAMDDLEK